MFEVGDIVFYKSAKGIGIITSVTEPIIVVKINNRYFWTTINSLINLKNKSAADILMIQLKYS